MYVVNILALDSALISIAIFKNSYNQVDALLDFIIFLL
jgi:hypothetical protein